MLHGPFMYYLYPSPSAGYHTWKMLQNSLHWISMLPVVFVMWGLVPPTCCYQGFRCNILGTGTLWFSTKRAIKGCLSATVCFKQPVNDAIMAHCTVCMEILHLLHRDTGTSLKRKRGKITEYWLVSREEKGSRRATEKNNLCQFDKSTEKLHFYEWKWLSVHLFFFLLLHYISAQPMF